MKKTYFHFNSVMINHKKNEVHYKNDISTWIEPNDSTKHGSQPEWTGPKQDEQGMQEYIQPVP